MIDTIGTFFKQKTTDQLKKRNWGKMIKITAPLNIMGT
jgi:hypothetical protein